MPPSPPSHVLLPDGRRVPLSIARGRSARARLSVSGAAVKLTLPPRSAWSPMLDRFLAANAAWIERALHAQSDAGALGRLANLEDARVALGGHAVPLVWHEGRVARAQVHGDDDEVHVWLPPSAREGAGRGVIRDLLEARLRRQVAAHLQRWLPTIPGGAVSRLSLRPTNAQWGSMSSGKRLALCASLVGAEPSALEYVVVHELCHQIHMDHSPAFWREVARRTPGHARDTAYLDRVGGRLKGMWARLEP